MQDVRSVTDMSYMFYYALVFNQDVSQWDVGSVTDMSYMFNDARVFNQDVSAWDVSCVTSYACFACDAGFEFSTAKQPKFSSAGVCTG